MPSSAGDARLYACHKYLRSPTIAQTSVSCYFTGASTLNVIVSKGTVLEVYEVLEGGEGFVLKQVESFALQGAILHLAVLKRRGIGKRDALAINFRDLKVEEVYFDPLNHTVTTGNLLNFELGPAGVAESNSDDAFLRVSRTPQMRHLFSADPEARCVALQSGGAALSIAPVLGAARSTAAGASWRAFTLSLSELGLQGCVKDLCFMHGYLEPTLCVLLEGPQSTAGRASTLSVTGTCCGLSLDTTNGSGAVVWVCNVLPSDCHSLFAAEPPRRGVLLVADNSLTYLDQQLVDAVALNGFADMRVEDPRDAPGYGRSHAGALRAHDPPLALSLPFGTHAAFLTPDHAAVTLPTGQVHLLQLARVALLPAGKGEQALGFGSSRVQLRLEPVAMLPSGGELCVLSNRAPAWLRKCVMRRSLASGVLAFLAARTGDAMLLHCDLLPHAAPPGKDAAMRASRAPLDIEKADVGRLALPLEGAGESKAAVEAPKKRRRKAKDEPLTLSAAAALEQAFLYGGSIEGGDGEEDEEDGGGYSSMRVRVLDRLLALGPISTLAVGPQGCSSAAAKVGDTLLGVGSEDSGALVHLRTAFRPRIGHAASVSHLAPRMKALRAAREAAKGGAEGEEG